MKLEQFCKGVTLVSIHCTRWGRMDGRLDERMDGWQYRYYIHVGRRKPKAISCQCGRCASNVIVTINLIRLHTPSV